MEPNQTSINLSGSKTSAKDFFLNLGAIVTLYVTVVALLNLLFTVINTAYPKVGDNYFGSSSVSLPEATIIIFFPLFVLLMWILEKGYKAEPQKRHITVRRWLTYITLFVAGLVLAGDLVTVLYFFLDGQELTAGFLLKALSVLVIASMIFVYYISDVREKLTRSYRQIWLAVAVVVTLGSIVWGFTVLGSPRNQQLLKYDQQKVGDLQQIDNAVKAYYLQYASMPSSIDDLSKMNNYYINKTDSQTKAPYEYVLIGQSAKAYKLCATFNLASDNKQTSPYSMNSWTHPAGRHCFNESIAVSDYLKPIPVR